MINDILDFSKLEADKMQVDYSPLKMSECVEDSIAISFRPTEDSKKNVDVAYFFHKEFPRIILGDGQRIRQIISNMLSNAFKFTQNGSITVHVIALPGNI